MNFKINNSTEKGTAQELINVVDIKNKLLYTRDGYAMAHIKIEPISINLLSHSEQKKLTSILTSSFSDLNSPFKIMAVSSPLDITNFLEEYNELLVNCTNVHQKKILRNSILEMSNYAMEGKVVERNFYMIIWEKANEDGEERLKKNVDNIIEKLNGTEIKAEQSQDHEIIRLCNLVNNPINAQPEMEMERNGENE